MPPQRNKETREIRLLEALDAYRTGYSHNINEIARVFDVSKTTLRRRIAKNTSTKRGGHNKRLNASQEAAIREWLERSIRHGFPPRQDHIQQMANKLLVENGVSTQSIGKCWVGRFLKRYPQYKTRRNQPLDARRHATQETEEIQKIQGL